MGQRFDPDRLEMSGQPFTLAGQVGRSTTAQAAVSVSAVNTLAYAGAFSQSGRLTWFDRAGNRSETSMPEGDYSDFRLSPDEKRLAASLVDSKTGQPDIWMTDLERRSSSRFTYGPAMNASALWSADGAQLFFRTNRNGGLMDIYQKSTTGGGSEAPVLAWSDLVASGLGSLRVNASDLSRDNDIIFSIPKVASGWDLWFFRIGDQKTIKFVDLPLDQLHANFSPNGRLVAYSSNDSGRFQVHVQTFPMADSKWTISTSGGYEPRWRGDGREIYYLSEDRKLMAVSVGPGPSFGVPKPLFQTAVPAGVMSYRTHYVPNRDGSRFLINTQSDPALNPITIVLNWTAGLK